MLGKTIDCVGRMIASLTKTIDYVG